MGSNWQKKHQLKNSTTILNGNKQRLLLKEGKKKENRQQGVRHQSKVIGMEDCWELSEGLFLCMRRLSNMRRSKELSVLERVEKSSIEFFTEEGIGNFVHRFLLIFSGLSQYLDLCRKSSLYNGLKRSFLSPP